MPEWGDMVRSVEKEAVPQSVLCGNLLQRSTDGWVGDGGSECNFMRSTRNPMSLLNTTARKTDLVSAAPTFDVILW